MPVSFVIYAAAMLAGAPTYAENSKVQRAPVPNWVMPTELMAVPESASGLVFVRRQDTQVHLGPKGQANYLGHRVKILHANALELGNLSVVWNPAAGAPVVHVIQIHRDGQVIDVLKNASFEILRREDQLEAASLNGVLTAVLRIPDLRVGDEIELGVTTPGGDPTLGLNDSGLLVLGPSPPPGRFRLAVSWDEGHKPQFKMTPEMAKVAKWNERSVRLDFDNPPLISPPEGAPPRYQWRRVVEYSDFSDWPAISRHFAPIYGRAAALEAASPLKQEAKRIAASHATPIERARAALKLVQQEVRYVYVGMDGANLTPASADETWRRRYGDCKAKTTLLLGLLTELGIEARAALVNNSGIDDGLEDRLPSPGLFDHVLVRARIDGSDYWLDGTLPPVAGPAAAPMMPYRFALPITAQGSPLERHAWKPAARPDEVTLYEIDARSGFDQPAKITTSTIVRGIKGLQQQVQLSAVTSAQLLAAMRPKLVGDGWQTVDDARWHYDAKAQASVMTIIGTRTIDWDDDEDGAKSLSLPGGGFSPPNRRARTAGEDQSIPHYNDPEFTCHATTVRLPTATKMQQWSFNTTFDTRLFGRNYYRNFEMRDGVIRMVRGSRTEQREIDAASVQRDNARVANFDNSMAWISFDPTGTASDWRSKGGIVPATYEIDWTADDVPCLSAAAKRGTGGLPVTR